METKNNDVYVNKICAICKKSNECDHKRFTEERFYNGIVNQRCKEYEYKDE